MPTYCYVCPECGRTEEIVRSIRDKEVVPECDCDELDGLIPMIRDYAAERVNVGDREYRRPIVSNALAISPSQITEHRRLFPDIQVTPEGQPVFTSYRQHDAYLKKIGAVKNPQRIRNRGKRIATGTK